MTEEETALVPSFHAVAVNATEMQEASGKIRGWLQRKVADIEIQMTETQAALDSAIKNKWKTQPFRSMLSRLGQQKLYYGKLSAASDAGFTIVPNMDVDVFAIRVKRASPIQSSVTERTGYKPPVSIEDEQEQRLAIGDGRYESPSQLTTTERSQRQNDKNETVHTAIMRAVDYDAIEFPLAIAHSQVMDATAHAMAMKIFDRIGIVPQRMRRGDPIVLGQITMKQGWQTKTASFLIAWYLDVRTL